VLAEAGITLSDVDHVAINQDGRANFVGKLHYILGAASRSTPGVEPLEESTGARQRCELVRAERAWRRIRWTGSRRGAPRGAPVLSLSWLTV
jgi:hypothetical protein